MRCDGRPGARHTVAPVVTMVVAVAGLVACGGPVDRAAERVSAEATTRVADHAAGRAHPAGAARGAAGAVAFTASETVEVPGRPVAVVDTVGAGDTFHAALLAHLGRTGALTRESLSRLSRDAIGHALAYAAAAAAVTCGRRGADLPRAQDPEFRALLAQGQG